ncbi:MAG: gliding motility-associated protein GldE [Schleiferiaceae bacterium]
MVSGSEVAFFSLTPTDLEELNGSETKRSKTLGKLIEQPKSLLASILIANNFINVGIVILSAYINAGLFDFTNSPLLGFIFNVVVITFLILMFGEVLPKVYANSNAVAFALFMASPIMGVRKTMSPLISGLVWVSNLFENQNKRGKSLSVNDLEHALELTDEDATTDDEHKILQGIVKFGSTTVKQIMKPRTDVVALDVQYSYEEVMNVIVSHGFSRIPVYAESFDEIKGILYIKDLLPYIEVEDTFDWKQLIREPFYVPEYKKIDDLLKEFQEKKIHLAIVVDEFGGTSGIITLEDVIEEIVGEINDEFDDEDLVYSKLDDKNYVFEGKTPLNDFYKVLDIDGDDFEDSKGDSDSLAGFILEISGQFPDKNDVLTFNQYTFTIEALEKRRIQRIKVTIEDLPTDEE